MTRLTYRIKDGKIIKGVLYAAFIHNFNFHLTDIKVYEDGMIDCWGLVDFEGFKEKVKSGWVRTQLPEDASFSMFPLGHAKCEKFSSAKTEEDFVLEVEDTIAKLQGRPGREDHCREVFEEFLREPTESKRTQLEVAYQNVPEHLRRYLLGDMDFKDGPIRKAIKEGTALPAKTCSDYLEWFFSHKGNARTRRR